MGNATEVPAAEVPTMEIPHRYPYNPPLRVVLLSFGCGSLWIAIDWFQQAHMPPIGLGSWHSFIGLIAIAFAIVVGVRRIFTEHYLVLDNDSLVLPIGLFQMRTEKIEYTSIRRVWRHYTTYYAIAVLQVATETQTQTRTRTRTFNIMSTFLPDNESFCVLEEFLTRKARENESAQKSQAAKINY